MLGLYAVDSVWSVGEEVKNTLETQLLLMRRGYRFGK